MKNLFRYFPSQRMATVYYSHRKCLDLLILCRPNLRLTTHINQQQTIHPLYSPFREKESNLQKRDLQV